MPKNVKVEQIILILLMLWTFSCSSSAFSMARMIRFNLLFYILQFK